MAETKGYHVMWEIDIDSAESPLDAAKQAWNHMRATGSLANVFDVIEHDGTDIVRIDLADCDTDDPELDAEGEEIANG